MIKYKTTTTFPVALLIILGLSACAGSEPSKSTQAIAKNTIKSKDSIPMGTADSKITINICRINSVVRMAESPDLYINSSRFMELSNGNKVIYHANKNDSYLLKTSSNPFVYRFKDEVLAEGKFEDGPIYMTIKAERNLPQGLSILFGGAIAESVRQGGESGKSNNWSVNIVTSDDYPSKCDE